MTGAFHITEGRSGRRWGGTNAVPKGDLRLRRCVGRRRNAGSPVTTGRRRQRSRRRGELRRPHQLTPGIQGASGPLGQRHPRSQGPQLGRAHGCGRRHQPLEPRRRRTAGVAPPGRERRTGSERGLHPQRARRITRPLRQSHRSGVPVDRSGCRERQRDVLRRRGVHGISLPARPKRTRTEGCNPVVGDPAVGALMRRLRPRHLRRCHRASRSRRRRPCRRYVDRDARTGASRRYLQGVYRVF